MRCLENIYKKINNIYIDGEKYMKKIAIASSAKFQDEINYWKEYFERKGYNVINYPKKINQYDVYVYEEIYREFYNSLVETDILFVLNEDKNGIEGYIGAETFAELSFIVANNIINNSNKEVYLLKMPSEQVQSYVEIMNFIKLGWVKIFDSDIEKEK